MSSSSTTALVSAPSKAASSAIASIEKNAQIVASQVTPTASALANRTAQTASSLVSQTAKLTPNLSLTPSKTAQSSSQPSLPPPSPGQYRHPRLTEIISRQNASSLSDRNIRNALTNVGALGITTFFGKAIYSGILAVLSTMIPSQTSATVTTILITLIRVLLIANTVLSLRPVIPYISKEDTVTDIPLTPSQRNLLGLPPTPQSQSQAQPQSQTATPVYMTPPRYRRSAGSFTSSPSSLPPKTDRHSVSATYSGSPQSTSRYTLGFSPSPSQSQTMRRSSSTAFSPAASPLLHKALQSKTQSSAQQSIDQTLKASTSGLSRSQSVRELGAQKRREHQSVPDTPSPTGGSGVKRSPGVNYKWMYDKGFGLSRSESMGF